MRYESTKTYGHDLGLSCAFRQWKAESHCHFIHGYSLAFRFTFGCETLNDNGWVVDFGGLKELKEDLKEQFDHKLLVAGDDPQLERFMEMHRERIADVRMWPGGVGCEKFAVKAWWLAWQRIQNMNRAENSDRVRVISCECMEHAGNSAIYRGDYGDS